MANDASLRRDFNHRGDLQVYLKAQFPEAVSYGDQLSSFRGGAQAAAGRLAEFRVNRYARTRNFLSGSVSGLSPYIRHGVLTLHQVAQHVLSQAGGLQPAYKFIQELAWRDYFQRAYFAWGDGVWLDREAWKTGFNAEDYASQMPPDVLSGTTHLACMDAFSHSLVTDGYLHNHARMWFAAYLVHWRRVKWQAGAAWFLTHLVDGDPASNNLSWQWVASTFSSKTYIFNRENLEHYTDGKFCAQCPSRHACPFDKPYAELSAELFAR